jgi:hypothetical protein
MAGGARPSSGTVWRSQVRGRLLLSAPKQQLRRIPGSLVEGTRSGSAPPDCAPLPPCARSKAALEHRMHLPLACGKRSAYAALYSCAIHASPRAPSYVPKSLVVPVWYRMHRPICPGRAWVGIAGTMGTALERSVMWRARFESGSRHLVPQVRGELMTSGRESARGRRSRTAARAPGPASGAHQDPRRGCGRRRSRGAPI